MLVGQFLGPSQYLHALGVGSQLRTVISRVLLAQPAIDQALTPWTLRSNPVRDQALVLHTSLGPSCRHYIQSQNTIPRDSLISLHCAAHYCSTLQTDRITQERSCQPIKLCNVKARIQTQVEANCAPSTTGSGAGLDPRIEAQGWGMLYG